MRAQLTDYMKNFHGLSAREAAAESAVSEATASESAAAESAAAESAREESGDTTLETPQDAEIVRTGVVGQILMQHQARGFEITPQKAAKLLRLNERQRDEVANKTQTILEKAKLDNEAAEKLIKDQNRALESAFNMKFATIADEALLILMSPDD
jgi:hypothetical protein